MADKGIGASVVCCGLAKLNEKPDCDSLAGSNNNVSCPSEPNLL